LPPGSALVLLANATGSPAPTLQWLKNGAVIAGATDTKLAFPSISAGDSATYTLIATNFAGSVASNGATVTVGSSTAPVITVQPAPYPSQPVGSNVTLFVSVTGLPTPTLQWLKDGAAIPGEIETKLSLPWFAPADAGTYSVVATNAAGSVTS